MSEEKKDGCCGTTHGGSSCCGTKKLLVAVLLGVLIFAAGMWFAKSQCSMGKTCPMNRMHAQ